MTTYALLTNVTAVQPAPTPTRGPSLSVKAHGPSNPNTPAQEQTFHVVVTGIGTVSVTVQPVVSNDNVNWIAYGDVITATGTNVGQASTGGSQPWARFGAYVTAISGTNATANLTMSA